MLPRPTVRLRLIATLSACVLTAVILGVFAFQALSNANNALRDVYQRNVVPMQAVLEMRDVILDMRGRMLLPALLASEEETAELQQEYAGFVQMIDSDWTLFRVESHQSEAAAARNAVQKAHEEHSSGAALIGASPA
ncbi:Tar ligand binding domain-containing protein [Kushneria aurantia]|uniref:Tar ligand binding domain-containing protein n=1 Tax=Kushneria aurantia TaxID=504092 RepID=A0ABV6G7V0_9GAMM|nr:Tar ligand binding domain-containing protein [Kushneria aurantia]